MPKPGHTLKVRIPNFMPNAHAWRRAVHAAVAGVQKRRCVRYNPTDKLEVRICFILQNPKLTILDLDNRLKDIFDALQGFVGDKGKTHGLRPIIPNDNQIYRVIAEKRRPPKVNRAALSTLMICRYDNHARTARQPRDTRKHQLTAGTA